MAEPPSDPGPSAKTETAGRRNLRRSILLVILVFVAYGIVTVMSEHTPEWVKLTAEDFPAEFRAARFGDGELAAGKPYLIRIKRTGHKRALPPRKMEITVLDATRATYRCRKRSRCPWITIAPLRCRLDGGPGGPCGFELFEFGRSGVKILPRRRCRLTRQGIRDMKISCPRAVSFGRKLEAASGATSGGRRKPD
ncbi:MAG: hypothetical protein P8Z76_08380 [Alphaproteobacteria bacterium]